MKYVFEVIGMGAKKYGGFEKYIVEEASQLQKKGYRLVVVFDREPLTKEYVADLEELGATIEILPQPTQLKFVRGFIQLLRKYRPEIIHTNFSSNLFLALPLGRLFGAKRLIATEHCFPDKKGFKNKVAAQIRAIISDNTLAVSKMSADNLRSATLFGANKTKTLYLGVEDLIYDPDKTRTELNINKDEIALMNIAYHNQVKGVDVLIEALNILINQYHTENLKLYQIGGGQTGDDTAVLHNLTEKHNLQKYVVWMGIRNDVPRLLSAGDIYVQPSRSEGIPLSIMEASIASLPVVATKVGGNPEAAVDGENAIIVEPENPRQLADAIMKLYKNKVLRLRYGARGRQIALEKFRLKDNVSKLIEKYYGL